MGICLFSPADYKGTMGRRRAKRPARGGDHGTLIFWGAMVLGGLMGILLVSLSSMAQKAEEVYDRMPRGDEIGARATCPVPAPEPLSPASRGEVRPQGDLRESVAAP